MSMPRCSPDPAAIGQLRDDHVLLEQRFRDVCARAHCDWQELDKVWDEFAQDVRAHLEFEETMLFPRLPADAPTVRALLDTLRAQHAEIRRQLEAIGVEIQLHGIRARTVDAFIELMRRHAALEDESLYPWALVRSRSATGSMRAVTEA
jgi:hemerythrin-like domain-containing protein